MNGRPVVSGRGTHEFEVSRSGHIAYAIYRAAVQKVNQTLVENTDGDAPNRHIPRDVRQRVWQEYGGVCASCSASEYLEFDHIIPIAKGGSNDQSNVQLLCRRCNQKKSDSI